MSSEILRRAAALTRERADLVTGGPWVLGDDRCVRGHDREILWDDSCDEKENDLDDGIYIASWHPAVALAVADWLDAEADQWEAHYAAVQAPSRGVDQPPAVHHGDTFGAANSANYHARRALAVARAYLGGES